MKIKTILTAILAVSVVSATTVMMTGCGEQKGNASATATTAETTVARSTASSDKGGQSQDGGSQSNDSNSQSQENSAESSADSMSDDNSSNDIGISYDDAIANVKAQAGSGAQILSAVEGKSPDGYHCWVVTVSPVSKSDDSEKVTYYSGYLFCYADNYQDAQVSAENSEDNDIGISYDDAISNVKAQAGSGAQILSAEEGKSPDGYRCWVVTVSPVSKSDDNETVTYYSGYLFCYAEQ